MKTSKTFYHLIVDRSGSMSNCVENTISGFNEQVLKIRQLEEQYPEQEITMGLTMFNHTARTHARDARPADMALLSEETYRPGGNTALLDAIGITVQQLEADWLRSKATIPATVVVVILTDGYENASRQFRVADIRAMISRLEETGEWTFSFLGATLDAVAVAEEMAIRRENSTSFDKTRMKEQVWDKLSSSSEIYFQIKGEKGDVKDFLK